MYQDIIKILASGDYYIVKKDLNKLLNDDSFIKKITRVHNPIIFDRFIKMCEYKIDTASIYETRNIFIKNTIYNLNDDNIYEFFDSKNDIIINRYLTEYIISYYFFDNYYNFMTNFYQMIHYLQKIKKTLINEEHLKLYSSFVDLKDLSINDKINFFKKPLNDNLKELFYDDMNIVKEDSHQNLVHESLKLSHENSIYDESVSQRLGVDVYVLNGEEFYGFVRCLGLKSDDLSDNYDYVNSIGARLGYSFSYIGNNNIGTSDYDGKSVTLFYDNIDYRDIMYVHHADLHAKKMHIQDDFLSEKENEIVTPSSLVGNTSNYNEVYIKSSEDAIKPTALVCYDNIKSHDIAFAEKYNLAILVINRSKYKRNETYEDDYDSYTYTI